MPKRTREHELEDESRQAFRSALPSRFVFRDEAPDYGVDGEVEEFGSVEGEATGIRFRVQLKATDDEDLRKALRVAISNDKADYYRSLDLPVLMVRYHAPSGRLFTRWFHQFDPDYKGDGTPASVRWKEDDVWDDGRPERLVADVRAYRWWRSPSLPLPIPAYRESPDEGVFGISATELSIALKARGSSRPDIIDFQRGEPDPGGLRLAVRSAYLGAVLGGVTGAVLHLDDSFYPEPSADQIAIDSYALVAIALAAIGQNDLAARIASTFWAQSSFAAHSEMLTALSAAMARARRITEALDLSERLERSDDPDVRQASWILTLPALFHSGSLSAAELHHFRDVLRARIARRRDGGDTVGAARASYTLANHLRASGEWTAAIGNYEEAARDEPAYRERSYFWHELGGVLFGAGRYLEAADAYERAVELGDDPLSLALQADCFMFAGEYGTARELFREFNSQEHEQGEYRLKEGLVDIIVDHYGIARHERQPEEALRLAGDIEPDLGRTSASALLAEVLSLDALCPLAWFNYGVAARHFATDDAEEAEFAAYLGAAVLNQRDAEAWANATICVSRRGAGPLEDILTTARRLFGEAGFLNALIQASGAESPEGREAFVSAVQQIFDRLPNHPNGGVVLRGYGPDGSAEEITLWPNQPEAEE